jgi:hypothetical protein
MFDVAGLTRVVLSLPDVELRVAWLRELLVRLPPERAAPLLDGLCEEGERLDPAAREAALALALLLIGLGECEVVNRLREEAAGRKLLSLDRMLRRAPPGSVLPRAQEAPVPDYGAGRELTLGERKSLARRPNRRSFEKLLNDPHPLVIRQLLQNPKLTESDVIRLVAHRPARREALAEIAQLPRWLSRPRVRLALLLNPGTPPHIAVPLLCACTRGELREVLESADTALFLRATARELFVRRPPIGMKRAGATVH